MMTSIRKYTVSSAAPSASGAASLSQIHHCEESTRIRTRTVRP